MVRTSQDYRTEPEWICAAVLILVSFLYQRFMTGKDEEAEQEG